MRIALRLAVLSIVVLAPAAGSSAQDEGVVSPGAAAEVVSDSAAETVTDPNAFAPVAGESADLAAYVWKKRPVVVFADSPNDPAFIEQMRLIEARWPELAKRDVVLITDTTPDPLSAVRRQLRPRGFSLVLMTKDGQVSIRKPLPWDGREIMRAIDKMPIRREEIRAGAPM